VAVAAASLELDALLDYACSLLTAELAVDRCEVLAAPAPVEGGLDVPLVCQGERFGVLLLSGDGALVELSPWERWELEGVAAVLALSMRGRVAPQPAPPLYRNLAERDCRRAVAMERSRIAQDLHDSAGQLITGLGLRLADHQADAPDDEWRARFDELLALSQRANDEMRTSIDGLLALEPGDCGLAASIGELCRDFERLNGAAVTFTVRGRSTQLGAAKDDALFRMAHEALVNVQRHARATSVTVELCSGKDSVSLSVRDNGVGLACQDPFRHGHFGIRTMQRRIEDVGGTLRIGDRAAQGVLVEAVIPHRKRNGYAARPRGGRR
jgi:signal transduction histidine kinase